MQKEVIVLPLSENVKAWYLSIWNKFKPFYEFRSFLDEQLGKQGRGLARRIMLDLFLGYGCEVLAVGRMMDEANYYFRCGNMYVKYRGPYVEALEKISKGEDILKIGDRFLDELFSLENEDILSEIRIAVGPQPVVDTDIGRFRVWYFEVWKFRPTNSSIIEPMLEVCVRWDVFYKKAPEVPCISIYFSSFNTITTRVDHIRTEEKLEVIKTVLSAIYEQKRDEINDYINRAYGFLSQLFDKKIIIIYLLY
jgi:hypothetical protein